jgi:hypothetical protein
MVLANYPVANMLREKEVRTLQVSQARMLKVERPADVGCAADLPEFAELADRPSSS